MNHDHSQSGMGKHMLIMLICCLVPIALVAGVSVFGLSLGPLQPLIPYVAALMCPLMMIGMMWMMMRDNKSAHSEHHSHVPPSSEKTQEVSTNVIPSNMKTPSAKETCH